MFGKNLKRLMAEQKLTPEALAVKLQQSGHEVTAAAVRSWMTDYRTPGLVLGTAVASALGSTTEEMLSSEPFEAAV